MVCQGLLLYECFILIAVWLSYISLELCRDMSGNVWKLSPHEVLWSESGSHKTLGSLPLQNVTRHSRTWSLYSDTLHWSDISLNRDLVTKLNLITVFDVITYSGGSIEHLQRVWLANDAYSSWHLVLSHLGLAFVPMLRPFIPEVVMSTDLLSFDHPSELYSACDYHFKSVTIKSVTTGTDKNTTQTNRVSHFH